MKHLLIALVVSWGLAFAPVAEAACKHADCSMEQQIHKKTEKPAKAAHDCGCHHQSASAYQLPAVMPAAPLTPSAVIVLSAPEIRSTIVSPLLEPPSHA